MAEERRLIWAENGLYLDRETFETLRRQCVASRAAHPEAGQTGTPVYVLPSPRPARWWVRAWRTWVRR